jgi:predicted DNA-binding protein with PD1-like motif
MQYSEGNLGRIFALRLEDGEPMPQTLESFLAERGITHGLAFMVGGADDGSKLVVGPEEGRALPVHPMVAALVGVHEILGVGTIFPDETGRPVLHMHGACGRKDSTITGCIRAGIMAWHILEIVVLEITGLQAARLPDAQTGFHLLQCEQ